MYSYYTCAVSYTHLDVYKRQLNNRIPEERENEDTLVIDIPNDGVVLEEILNEISITKETEKSVSSKKEKMNLDLSAELKKIQVEEFDYAKKQIRHLLITLTAMKSAAERSLQVCIIL